jgi:rubrerythrin
MSAPGPQGTKKGDAATDIATASDLLMRAHAMEVEAADRYEEFAAQMELHNNREVAELFHKLAGIERKHADSLAVDLLTRGVRTTARVPLGSLGEEGLETGSAGALHYLMTPYHALEIALRNERRALAFFGLLAEATGPVELRELAREFASEEAEHVELLQQWLARTAKPRDDWAYDPDEPRVPD